VVSLCRFGHIDAGRANGGAPASGRAGFTTKRRGRHKEEGVMVSLDINGKRQNVDVPGETPLLWTLRDELGLTGSKFGCGMALCGACTVHVNGKAVRSCITPISAVANSKIVTIEAVGAEPVGRALQAAWVDNGVPQCGYCQAGQIMSAAALLRRLPNPSDAQIDEAMDGNICRCGTYTRIRAAIKQAAAKQGGAR
jgi:isoquinoline 1-oxidoreductase alpha subunit